MIGVDLIGQIKRACFGQQRPIKQIVKRNPDCPGAMAAPPVL
jgi:hypothetical protein